MTSESLFVDRVAVGKQRSPVGIRRVKLGAVRAGDLELVRRGDEGALARIVEEFSTMVYRVAVQITASEADATDVLQDVFVHLPESLQLFDGRNFAGWLKVVTSRRALMMLRSERRRERRRSGTTTVTSWEDRSLTRIALEHALARLDPMLRAVFILKELEGFTHREIAETLHISENLSQVRLHRARRALRRLLISP